MARQNWSIDRTKYLNPEHCRRLVGYCQDASDLDNSRGRRNMVTGWMAMHLGVSAGLRVSEIQDVRIGDCHVGYGESHVWVRNGKGNKPGMVIIGKALKQHLKQYLRLRREWGEDVSPEAHLLISERRRAYTRSALQKKFKVVAARAGLPAYFSIHCLRHTFGCELLRQTRNLRLVQKQMRHANISTTTVYADVLDEEIQGAMDRME
jgi:site-specific recombinase XerD